MFQFSLIKWENQKKQFTSVQASENIFNSKNKKKQLISVLVPEKLVKYCKMFACPYSAPTSPRHIKKLHPVGSPSIDFPQSLRRAERDLFQKSHALFYWIVIYHLVSTTFKNYFVLRHKKDRDKMLHPNLHIPKTVIRPNQKYIIEVSVSIESISDDNVNRKQDHE